MLNENREASVALGHVSPCNMVFMEEKIIVWKWFKLNDGCVVHKKPLFNTPLSCIVTVEDRVSKYEEQSLRFKNGAILSGESYDVSIWSSTVWHASLFVSSVSSSSHDLNFGAEQNICPWTLRSITMDITSVTTLAWLWSSSYLRLVDPAESKSL